MMFLLDLVKDSWIEESLLAAGLCYPPQSHLTFPLYQTLVINIGLFTTLALSGTSEIIRN